MSRTRRESRAQVEQHRLRPAEGAKKSRKRVGRGDGSGRGTYSGRGLKGQKSRSGPGIRLGFQGGGLPLIKSLPKLRGFTRANRTLYSVVNLDSLARLPAGSVVTPKSLVEAGLVKSLGRPVKVLGRGELDLPLTVEAHKFSRAARRSIEAAGGTATEVS